jgi:hypothetical protein
LGELNDIAKSEPEKVKELEKTLLDYMEKVHSEVLKP